VHREQVRAKPDSQKGAKDIAIFDRVQAHVPRLNHAVTSHALADAVVSAKGAKRWQQGHPWIYRSDVAKRPAEVAGTVRVLDARGRALGVALWSPQSEISLRLLDRDPAARIDAGWWRDRLTGCIARREPLRSQANA
jgi:hypothetical protein